METLDVSSIDEDDSCTHYLGDSTNANSLRALVPVETRPSVFIDWPIDPLSLQIEEDCPACGNYSLSFLTKLLGGQDTVCRKTSIDGISTTYCVFCKTFSQEESCQTCSTASSRLWAIFLVTAINAVSQMAYTMGDRWKASIEDEQLIISLSSTHSEKVSWVTILVESTVTLLVNMKAYLGTAPAPSPHCRTLT